MYASLAGAGLRWAGLGGGALGSSGELASGVRMMYVWCTYDVRMVSSHGRCVERLVLSQNSFWLGKCYTLLQPSMDFQWILDAQSMQRLKVPPPVSGVLPREK